MGALLRFLLAILALLFPLRSPLLRHGRSMTSRMATRGSSLLTISPAGRRTRTSSFVRASGV